MSFKNHPRYKIERIVERTDGGGDLLVRSWRVKQKREALRQARSEARTSGVEYVELRVTDLYTGDVLGTFCFDKNSPHRVRHL